MASPHGVNHQETWLRKIPSKWTERDFKTPVWELCNFFKFKCTANSLKRSLIGKCSNSIWLSVMPTPWVWRIFHCIFLVFKWDLHKTEHLRRPTFNKKTIYREGSFSNTNKEQEPEHFFFYGSNNTKCRTTVNKGDCYPHSLLAATSFQAGYFFCFFIRVTFAKKRVSEKKTKTEQQITFLLP